jgi:hypothetical protein
MQIRALEEVDSFHIVDHVVASRERLGADLCGGGQAAAMCA